MDLLSTIPSFSTTRYAHIIASLERKQITTADLLTLDALEIAKRAQVPPAEVRRLCAEIIQTLRQDLGFGVADGVEEGGDAVEGERRRGKDDDDVPSRKDTSTRLLRGTEISGWPAISCLDPDIDALLDGGIPTGYLTEVTGERLVFLYMAVG
jgi:DNA repair protein RAD57